MLHVPVCHCNPKKKAIFLCVMTLQPCKPLQCIQALRNVKKNFTTAPIHNAAVPKFGPDLENLLHWLDIPCEDEAYYKVMLGRS